VTHLHYIDPTVGPRAYAKPVEPQPAEPWTPWWGTCRRRGVEGGVHDPKKSKCFYPNQKLLPVSPGFEKQIALAFLKAA